MKIEKNIVTNVEKEVLAELKEIGETVTYTTTSNLFYEGQTPVVAYLLISGEVHLTKSKVIKETLGPGSLLGVREMMHHTPIDHTAVTTPETEVCFLSMTDIKEILADKNQSELSLAIGKIITL